MFLHAVGFGIVTAAVMSLAGGVLPYIEVISAIFI